MSRSNAEKKAARRAAVVPKTRDEADDMIEEVLLAAKKVDVEAGLVYPQPERCQNCGNWVLVMAQIGTKVCGRDCEKAMEERKARREAKQGSSADADGGSLGAKVNVQQSSSRVRHSA